MGPSALSDEESTDPTATLFDPNASLINVEEWLLRADYAALSENRQGPAQARLEQVKQVLVSLLPDVDDITIRGPGGGKLGGSLKGAVRFHTPYGEVPLSGLSLGYQTMAAWTVDLAARLFERYPDSPDPLAEPAVVLVDEIDLHLHPQWQRKLLDFLSERFPNTQFIATAHSPLVVQARPDANLAVLRREGDHVVIDNDPERVAGWRVDQVLTSDLFGLESARPPREAALLEERATLLGKARLSSKEKARVAAIERELEQLPTGETAEDRKAMDVLRRAAALLEKRSQAGG